MIGKRNRKKIYTSIVQSQTKISICDVGSAGERPYFLNEISNSLIYTDFEANSNGELFGLGKHEAIAKLYRTKNSHMSSVYKPNIDYLSSRFQDSHWSDREVQSAIEFKVVKLDDIFDTNKNLDFLKIDTQGSEYSVLQGAKNTILKHKPIIYCECWLDSVYEDAPLADKIMDFMFELNYRVAALQVGADWDTQNAQKIPGRKIPVGIDFIFVPDPSHLKENENNDIRSIIAKCAILECLGLFQLAIEVSKTLSSKAKSKCPYFMTQSMRIESLPHPKLVKLLDAFARGPFKNFKLVPNLYD